MKKSATTQTPIKETKPSSFGRWAKRLLSVVLGLAVGVGVAEAIFWIRDEGSFPHLNCYIHDDELGVRLEPGATQRFKFQDNPLTRIRINAQGYRGPDFPPPTPDEILVVGDSQVFGLGVEEHETIAARLQELTGRQTINGGVPTYGPIEYNAVVKELLEARTIKTVVYVVNSANDLFENERPNRERHKVWDGWAVRAETAPESITEFWGRELLFRHSHLFYALRRWLYEQGPKLDDRGFESEGTWTDLVHTAEDTEEEHSEAKEKLERLTSEQQARLAKIREEIKKAEDEVDEFVLQNRFNLLYAEGSTDYYYQAARGNPGDIVIDRYEEAARPLTITAQLIRKGVSYRQRVLAKMLRGQHPDEIEALLEKRERLKEEGLKLRAEVLTQYFVPSVLEPRLQEVKALCDKHGAELVVVALPLDVMVSPEEWKKYGTEPIDMEPTRVLLSDLVQTAERMGVRALDATDALKAAQPGAFLHGDLHMTPKGQAAVAAAIAARLAEPAPIAHPLPGLPEGRSRVPDPEEWLRTPEAIVKGSSKAGCETIRIREWLRISCLKQERLQNPNIPTGVTLLAGGHGEAMILSTQEASTLIAPIFPGDTLLADFFWKDRAQKLVVHWPKEQKDPEMFFEEPRPQDARPQIEVSEAAQKLCECYVEVSDPKVCAAERGAQECTCAYLYGHPAEECLAAWGDDCANLLRCVRGDPLVPPPCPGGYTNAGGTGLCFPLCSEEAPCKEGRCEPWQGTGICRPEEK